MKVVITCCCGASLDIDTGGTSTRGTRAYYLDPSALIRSFERKHAKCVPPSPAPVPGKPAEGTEPCAASC